MKRGLKQGAKECERDREARECREGTARNESNANAVFDKRVPAVHLSYFSPYAPPPLPLPPLRFLTFACSLAHSLGLLSNPAWLRRILDFFYGSFFLSLLFG